jgi:hypothetical protein
MRGSVALAIILKCPSFDNRLTKTTSSAQCTSSFARHGILTISLQPCGIHNTISLLPQNQIMSSGISVEQNTRMAAHS